ncbi:MAG TPA: amidohydrolase family protein [Frankiaceae bacterium]|nr:amidohydrolase family protein [Frankiaceae bacterium]
MAKPPKDPGPPVLLRARRMLDVVTGEYVEPGALLIEGERITQASPASVPPDAIVIDLGDLTLLPGLMDMEINMLLGGPSGGNPRSDVQDDPAFRTLRAIVNCRTTLQAGFTTVRNLGLFVRTGGVLLDVALSRACDLGWVDGPRIVPAGHAITPTGGHLDPTMFQRLGPGIMPLSVEEGIANGVPEVRKAVRYQLKYGARVIKISASGGVMSHSGEAGAQQYSDEELVAIVDEAHRAGIKVAAHAHGDAGIRACIRAGVDCIEHGSLATDETIALMVEHGTFLVPTSYLSEGLDISRAAPELKAKAAEVFPKARRMLGKAIEAGVKIACGTDAPAVPHGQNAKELWAMVDRGMTPLGAIQAATLAAAELISVDDRGRLEAGLLADIIAVPGDPLTDITVTEDVRFVMKGGQVYRNDTVTPAA